MSTLSERLLALAARAATEDKAIRSLVNGNAADLAALSTSAKANLIAAINELKTAVDNVQAGVVDIIDDAATTSAVKTYSIDKIKVLIQAAKDELLGGAPSAALDTIAELATALTNDQSAVAAITTALTFRVRVDAAQTFTAEQQLQGCTNLGIGNPDADLVAAFNTALV